MKYFPRSLILHAQLNGLIIGLNDFRKIATPVSPYLPEGNICIEKLPGGGTASLSPIQENYILGLIIRHKDETLLSGDNGLVDLFMAYLKSIRGIQIDSGFIVQGFNTDIEKEFLLNGDNYYYYLNQINMTVQRI